MNGVLAWRLALCTGLCCAFAASAKQSPDPEPAQSDASQRAESPSAVLQARRILLLTIAQVEEGPWQAGARGGQSQALRIVARLGETLLGPPLLAGADGLVALQATRARRGPRDSAAPGVWSEVDLAPGAQLVLLSRSASTVVAQALAEATLIGVLPAEPAAEEIRRGLRLHRSAASLADALRSIKEPPALSALFAEYLVARLYESLRSGDKAGFDAAMAWLEQPGRSTAVQAFVVDALTTRVLSQPPERAAFVERLALAQWRLLTSTSDAVLASQIESTWLPNLLGLEGAAAPIGRQAVFRQNPAERGRIAEAMQRRPESETRARLLRWLGA